MIIKKDRFSFSFDPQKCSECGGKCCTGESGYVFASIEELIQIAEFLEMNFDEFALKYLKKVGYRFSFLEKSGSNGAECVFFCDGKCLIYDLRPKQCVDFPFWQGFMDKDFDAQEIVALSEDCIGVGKK